MTTIVRTVGSLSGPRPARDHSRCPKPLPAIEQECLRRGCPLLNVMEDADFACGSEELIERAGSGPVGLD
jgi:hypothetical protein